MSGRLARSPVAPGFLIVATPNAPFGTVEELVAFARANPGKLNFGSAGIGTPMHVTGEMFKFQTGAAMQHIPLGEAEAFFKREVERWPRLIREAGITPE